MWPGGHQYSDERVVGLGDEHGLRAARAVAVGAEDLELVHAAPCRTQSEPFEPLISHWKCVAPAEREPRRLDRPDGAAVELDDGLDRVVDLPSRDERLDDGRERGDLADEEAAQVDDVGREVADRARAGVLGAEAPGVERSGRRPSPGGSARGSGGSRRARRASISSRASRIAGTKR